MSTLLRTTRGARGLGLAIGSGRPSLPKHALDPVVLGCLPDRGACQHVRWLLRVSRRKRPKAMLARIHTKILKDRMSDYLVHTPTRPRL